MAVSNKRLSQLITYSNSAAGRLAEESRTRVERIHDVIEAFFIDCLDYSFGRMSDRLSYASLCCLESFISGSSRHLFIEEDDVTVLMMRGRRGEMTVAAIYFRRFVVH